MRLKIQSLYDLDTAKVNYPPFWFLRFRSRNFDVEDPQLRGRPIVKNVSKIIEIVEFDRYVSTVSIT